MVLGSNCYRCHFVRGLSSGQRKPGRKSPTATVPHAHISTRGTGKQEAGGQSMAPVTVIDPRELAPNE